MKWYCPDCKELIPEGGEEEWYQWYDRFYEKWTLCPACGQTLIPTDSIRYLFIKEDEDEDEI